MQLPPKVTNTSVSPVQLEEQYAKISEPQDIFLMPAVDIEESKKETKS
jgi:hypothetical protein